MQLEFDELVLRASGRDEVAAAELIRRFEPDLRRLIRSAMTDRGLRRLLDTVDVSQSVLAAFFVRLRAGGYRAIGPRQLASLLELMARHEVIDQARRQRAARRGGGAIQLGEWRADPAARDREPGDCLADRELLEIVRTRMAEADRELLDSWLAGQSWAEIATRLGGGAEALRKRLGRAITEAAGRLGVG